MSQIGPAAWHARVAGDWGPHPMFGKMSYAEWGKLLQIHIDYHLKQFAAEFRTSSESKAEAI